MVLVRVLPLELDGFRWHEVFYYTSYEVKDGMVHVEILNHALDQYIGAIDHKPNFMGDKKSYITTWSWMMLNIRTVEKVSCAYEKCARISDFQ